jgi:hypothetical protein
MCIFLGNVFAKRSLLFLGGSEVGSLPTHISSGIDFVFTMCYDLCVHTKDTADIICLKDDDWKHPATRTLS